MRAILQGSERENDGVILGDRRAGDLLSCFLGQSHAVDEGRVLSPVCGFEFMLSITYCPVGNVNLASVKTQNGQLSFDVLPT